MDKVEALSKMNSDMQLWDAAESKDLGGGQVEKTITLPWGIGATSVVLEGMTDAGKRRAAVGAYGEYIRGVIDDKIGEQNVTARAKQKAASASDDSSREDDLGDAVHDDAYQEEAEAESDQGAVQASEDATGGELDPNARLSDLRRRVGEANNFIRRATKEIEALEAYVSIMGAAEGEEEDGN